ncbi:hypothetical protein CRG98_014169 [Punica granatum]|uniref:Uncharacterized protein n=1 Tax=Punica granatum TaxID=22663 RepID=A0A2I0KB47_PUNGR|nr:hypothetical protein CRG98_014169 [Punica granatum]
MDRQRTLGSRYVTERGSRVKEAQVDPPALVSFQLRVQKGSPSKLLCRSGRDGEGERVLRSLVCEGRDTQRRSGDGERERQGTKERAGLVTDVKEFSFGKEATVGSRCMEEL